MPSLNLSIYPSFYSARWLRLWQMWPLPWPAPDLVDLPLLYLRKKISLFSSDEKGKRWWEMKATALGRGYGRTPVVRRHEEDKVVGSGDAWGEGKGGVVVHVEEWVCSVPSSRGRKEVVKGVIHGSFFSFWASLVGLSAASRPNAPHVFKLATSSSP